MDRSHIVEATMDGESFNIKRRCVFGTWSICFCKSMLGLRNLGEFGLKNTKLFSGFFYSAEACKNSSKSSLYKFICKMCLFFKLLFEN